MLAIINIYLSHRTSWIIFSGLLTTFMDWVIFQILIWKTPNFNKVLGNYYFLRKIMLLYFMEKRNFLFLLNEKLMKMLMKNAWTFCSKIQCFTNISASSKVWKNMLLLVTYTFLLKFIWKINLFEKIFKVFVCKLMNLKLSVIIYILVTVLHDLARIVLINRVS